MQRSSAKPAAGNDALGDRGLGRADGVVERLLLRFHLRFGGRADPDHRDAARELRQPLLQLLAVVVAGRLLDFATDLVDAAVDLLAIAGAADDRRVVLVDDDALGAPELLDRRVLELEAQLLGNHLPAGQNRDVLQASPCGGRRIPAP